MRIRPRQNPKTAELKELPLFAGLKGKLLQLLASNLDEVRVPAGEMVLSAGKTNDTFWILLEGEVEVTIGGLVHETLKAGDVLGLPSMFSRRDSTADAIAKVPLRALVASHTQLNALLGESDLEVRFKAAMFDRLRDEVYQLTHQPKLPAARPRAKAAASAKTTPKPKAKTSARS